MNREGKKSSAKGFMHSQIYFEFGIKVAVSFCFFGLGGSWLDSKFDTTPWLTIIGIALGIVAFTTSFYQFIKMVIRKK